VQVLPDSLTLLTNLNQLALSMNPLINLPVGMTALQQLRILEMYYVKLEDRAPQSSGTGKTLQVGVSRGGEWGRGRGRGLGQGTTVVRHWQDTAGGCSGGGGKSCLGQCDS
jgi:hypothetical protein